MEKVKASIRGEQKSLARVWDGVVKKEATLSKTIYNQTMHIHTFMDMDTKLEGAGA